jgi:hypothetical protein
MPSPKPSRFPWIPTPSRSSRTAPTGREAWHLSAGASTDAATDRRAPQIVARSRCRFLRVSYGGLPVADRRRHLEVQLATWAPFTDPGHALVEGPLGCAVFAWDATALAEQARAAALPWPAPQTWPESLYIAPPAGADGDATLQLVPCREGCEARLWRSGELVASRWWPQWPDTESWLNFQRGASVPDSARSETPPPASDWPGVAALSRPWATPTTLQALRERQQLPQHALAAFGLLALLLPTLWLATDLWQTLNANQALAIQVQRLEADAQPVLRIRANALEGLAALDTLGPAFERSDPLALLAHLSQRLGAAGGAVVRELDWNGTRLRLVLAVPAARPRVAYVQALEDGGLLRDVREDTQDVEPGLLALVAELAQRPPASSAGARP